jgi:protein gp37
MAQTTGIEWCDATFNPWLGCTKVSPGCAHCYAEVDTPARHAKSIGLPLWGPNANRQLTSETYWKQPLTWNRFAEKAGRRLKVFCASQADVFEDWPGQLMNSCGDPLSLWKERGKPALTELLVDPNTPYTLDHARVRLWNLIEQTPWLYWLLLTKRPENMVRMTPESWRNGWPLNVVAMTSVEDQRFADRRIPALLAVPAKMHGISAEPLLGPIDLRKWIWPTHWHWSAEYDSPEQAIAAGGFAERKPQTLVSASAKFLDWVIAGGESGTKNRSARLEWFQSLAKQCKKAGTTFFMKQMGKSVVCRNDCFGGCDDSNWPDDLNYERVEHNIHGFKEEHQGADCRVTFSDKKGGDPEEWPPNLRVRESFPPPNPTKDLFPTEMMQS